MKRGGPLKRTPLERGSKPLKRTAMKPSRPKGRARPDEPLARVCVVASQVCTGRPTERHHRLRRSQGGTDDSANTVDLCRECHSHIHANPAWAYERGWLVRR